MHRNTLQSICREDFQNGTHAVRRSRHRIPHRRRTDRFDRDTLHCLRARADPQRSNGSIFFLRDALTGTEHALRKRREPFDHTIGIRPTRHDERHCALRCPLLRRAALEYCSMALCRVDASPPLPSHVRERFGCRRRKRPITRMIAAARKMHNTIARRVGSISPFDPKNIASGIAHDPLDVAVIPFGNELYPRDVRVTPQQRLRNGAQIKDSKLRWLKEQEEVSGLARRHTTVTPNAYDTVRCPKCIVQFHRRQSPQSGISWVETCG